MAFILNTTAEHFQEWLEIEMTPWRGVQRPIEDDEWLCIQGVETEWRRGQRLLRLIVPGIPIWVKDNHLRTNGQRETILLFELLEIGPGRLRVQVSLPRDLYVNPNSRHGRRILNRRLLGLELLRFILRRVQEDFLGAPPESPKASERESILPAELWALEEKLPNGRLPGALDELAELLSCYEKHSELWRLALGVWWVLVGNGAVTQETLAEHFGISTRSVASYVRKAKDILGLN